MTFRYVREFFKIPDDKPELILAQLRAFSRQIPLLYSILLANMLFVSATHWGSAPLWLVCYVPIAFGLAALVRMVGWWKARNFIHTPAQATKRLKSTVLLVGLFGFLLTAWSMGLLRFGNALQQGHVVFFMAATMVACVFCLMHLRAAAFLLAGMVAIPYSVQFAVMDSPVMWAVSANFLLMCGTTLYMMSIHYDDFAAMVEHRVDLETKNSEMRRLNDTNYKLANMDALTDLPNRRSFIASIKKRVELCRVNGAPFAVGLIDLDGFKAVNDLYGHAAGDALLIEASKRLCQIADENLFFARLGGDEFGFIAAPIHRLGAIGKTICEVLGEPYDYEGITAKVSASCGMSLFPATCSSETELLEYADYALYQAKNSTPGTAIIFNGNHRDQLRLVHQVDQTLRSTNLEHEMRLVYQPVVNSTDGKVVSVEALARWSSEVLGQVAPSQFITTAERSPLINKVTLALLRRLLKDMQSLPQHLRVSFNLSAKSLCQPQSMLQIIAAIQRSGIDPRRLEFEVTESALIANFEYALQSLQLLRNLGVTVALDDFGTGYSSLSYIQELPLDKLKIDRGFIGKAATDNKANNIVKSIVDLSLNLHLQCVAEGIETAEQVEMLEGLGCTLMQGFYFAKPMPLQDLQVYLQKNNRPQKATG